MRVCVVTTPSPFLLDQRVFPALGILKVAAVLEQSGIAVDHLDLTGVANYEDAARDYDGDATVFAITATTPQVPAAMLIANVFRGRGKLILGGPHATLISTAAKNGNSRAKKALSELLGAFDCIVAGDGEKSIFTALHSKGLVDADDPKSIMWQSSKDFTESPWPARHLLDMDSYHYSISGAKAAHLIGQLGCLAPNTMIALASGIEIPISEIKRGDIVLSYNIERHGYVGAPVAFTWCREAEDIWELTFSDANSIQVTSEHPIWTERGWRTVADINVGESCAAMREMRRILCNLAMDVRESEVLQHEMLCEERPIGKDESQDRRETGYKKATDRKAVREMRQPILCSTIQSRKRNLLFEGVQQESDYHELRTMRKVFQEAEEFRGEGSILQSPMSMGVAEKTPERQVDGSRTDGDACEVRSHDRRGAPALLQRAEEQYPNTDSRNPQETFRHEARQSESNEASRSGGESGDNYEIEAREDSIGAVQADVERRETWSTCERRTRHIAQQARSQNDQYFEGVASDLQICRERGVLDWSMSIGQAEKPGLYRQEESKGYSPARRVLAYGRISSSRPIGLLEQGVDAVDRVDEGIENTAKKCSLGKTALVWNRVTSKRFIGRGVVHNITVCPVHNYFSAGVLVHNCPYHCTFCSGRNSPMLRRIRLRTPDSVLAEVRHLYETYGFTGINYFDDELNVNREMIPLMKGMAALAKELGIEWKLRGFVKSELFNEEQAEAMYEAGFRWILCGFESGSDRILTNIQKMATREQNTRCMEIAHKHGLKVKALMSLGHAGESPQTVQDTYDWLLETRPDDADVTVITPYPGSPYWDDATPIGNEIYRYTAPKTGDFLYMEEVDFTKTADYYKGIMGSYISHVWTDDLSREELVKQRDWLELTVKEQLGIAMPPSAAAVMYEHSTGMTPQILRSTK